MLAEPRQQQILHGANLAAAAGTIRRMRRLLVVAGVLIVSRAPSGRPTTSPGTITAATSRGRRPSSSRHRLPSCRAPTSRPSFARVRRRAAAPPRRRRASCRPPFRLVWVSGGTSLVEFPPAVAFHYLYYASSPETWSPSPRGTAVGSGPSTWAAARHPRPRSTGSAAARSSSRSSTASRAAGRREEGRRRDPQRSPPGAPTPFAGASTSARPRRRRSSSTTGSTSATAEGNVYCLKTASTARPLDVPRRRSREGSTRVRPRPPLLRRLRRAPLLAAGDRRQAPLARRTPTATGSAGTGQFYSTPAVAYSRVYLGSTDGHVYSFGQQSGKLRWAYGTGGFVYGSPAVWRAASSWARTTTPSMPSTPRRETSSGSSTRTAPSRAPTVVDGIVYFATLKPPHVRPRRATGSSCGRIRTARSRRS